MARRSLEALKMNIRGPSDVAQSHGVLDNRLCDHGYWILGVNQAVIAQLGERQTEVLQVERSIRSHGKPTFSKSLRSEGRFVYRHCTEV